MLLLLELHAELISWYIYTNIRKNCVKKIEQANFELWPFQISIIWKNYEYCYQTRELLEFLVLNVLKMKKI